MELKIQDPVTFYEKNIKERETFSKFMIGFNKPVIDLFTNISNKLSSYKDNVIWIGGSRSWDNRFNKCKVNLSYPTNKEFVEFLKENEFFKIKNITINESDIILQGDYHTTFQTYRLLLIVNKYYKKEITLEEMNKEIERENQIYILEKVSIIPGNFDIFLLSSNYYDTTNTPNNVHKNIVCYILEEINRLKSMIMDNNHYGDYYKVKVIKNKINTEIKCEINHSYEKNFCTLFPCQSIELSIQPKNIKEYRRGLKDRDVKEQEPKIKKSLTKELDLPVKELKIVLYFESAFVPGLDIQKFKRDFLDGVKCANNSINYLNEQGLLFMNELITKPRRHKGIYIDKYRKELLLNELRLQSKTNIYEMYLKLYKNLFNEFKIHNILLEKGVYLRGDIVRNMFLYSGTDIEEIITQQIIKILRPYVNVFLENLNKSITGKDDTDAKLVLVGGDAMRRYDINITNTNDFDARIYTKPIIEKRITRKTKDDMELIKDNIKEILLEKLSEFTTLLNVLNENSASEIIDIPINLSSDIISRDNIKITYSMRTYSNQFRSRYIERSKQFPVDLYSIDFITDYQVNTRDFSIIKPITIPFLDISIKETTKIKNIEQNIYNGIPVMGINTLLSDILYTYSPRNNQAISRYWNNKIDKDLVRYNKLVEIKGECEAINCKYTDISETELNMKADINWKEFNKTYRNDISDYLDKFKTLISDNKENNIVKHKMRYNEKHKNDQFSDYDKYDNYLDDITDELFRLNVQENEENEDMDID
jgi:hypothetical protein